MTIRNMVELLLLVLSVPLVIFMVRRSNRKVSDLDGCGEIMKENEQEKKGVIVAQL